MVNNRIALVRLLLNMVARVFVKFHREKIIRLQFTIYDAKIPSIFFFFLRKLRYITICTISSQPLFLLCSLHFSTNVN